MPERRPPLDSVARDDGPALTRGRFLSAAGLGMTAFLGRNGAAKAMSGVLAGARPALADAAPVFRSESGLQPPAIAIGTRVQSTTEGLVFVAPFGGGGPSGPLIVDDTGNPVWFNALPQGAAATDFRVQEYLGAPVLTWWEGKILAGYGRGESVIMDASYREVARISAGNGYEADLHEFLLTPENTALITVYAAMPADLSTVGGPSNGTLLESIVQEVDVRTGAVMLEWHAREHASLQESFAAAPGSPSDPYDWFHVNSIDVDQDGNLLVSSRHTWTIYKVERATGNVLWRLGGKQSDFGFGDGADFAWQHDARRRADGAITLFDNGAGLDVEHQSRGLVLALDPGSMTASAVRQYLHPDGLSANAMGSVQTLPGGDVLVGWGLQPWFSSFTSDGNLDFDANFPGGEHSYRAYRLPWTAHPSTLPSLAAVLDPDSTTTIYASWNGATEVARWVAYAGTQRAKLEPVATAPRQGFETAIRIRHRGGFGAVAALDKSGRILGTSRPIPLV